jgi:serine protease AprX
MAVIRTWFGAISVCALVLSAAAPAQAAHRARLSGDLANHLQAGTQSIDVIVHGSREAVDALARQYNLSVKKYLRAGAVLHITAGQLAALAADETQDHLSADLPIRSTGDLTAETIEADQVWAGAGALNALSGAGITVAVIDSGVDPHHQALKGRLLLLKDFTGGDGVDRYGHGTHVAGIIAGAPGRSADTRDYRGVAYGANIVSLRVLDEKGAGLASDVIEAIDWAIENRRAYNIRVINLSLGAPVVQPYRDDPLCEAVERAVAAGIVVVAAAGNHGVTSDGKLVLGSIDSPGNDPAVITVGALDTHGTAERADDTVARFSAKGPTRYDLVLKPDLVAPGIRVVSAEASGAYLTTTYPARHVAGSGSHGYTEMSGTSMAAAVVSGTAALLLQERPRLAPVQLKLALGVTSTFMPAEGLIRGGMGSLNALNAATLVLNASLDKYQVRFVSRGERRAARGRELRILLSSTGGIDTITWGNGGIATITWGNGGTDIITWGNGGTDIITWGNGGTDTITWGNGGTDTITWGNGGTDTITWGNGGTDTITWGNAGTDTITWGNGGIDTITWGNGGSDTITWGNGGDTITWGNTIVDANQQ